jgi:hypothetical protein
MELTQNQQSILRAIKEIQGLNHPYFQETFKYFGNPDELDGNGVIQLMVNLGVDFQDEANDSPEDNALWDKYFNLGYELCRLEMDLGGYDWAKHYSNPPTPPPHQVEKHG